MAMNEEHTPLYPLFLDLDGKPCLVVGGGAIGHQKVTALLHCGAQVTITAIDVCDDVATLANSGKVTLNRRAYEACEAEAYHLVIAATSDNAINTWVRDDAHIANRLVNVVDVPHLCDFQVPAIVQRGRLQVAISTAGASPSIAKRLKRDLDGQLPQQYDRLMDELMAVRNELKQLCPDSLRDRMNLNTTIAESSAVDDYLGGNETPLKDLIDDALAPYRNQP